MTNGKEDRNDKEKTRMAIDKQKDGSEIPFGITKPSLTLDL